MELFFHQPSTEAVLIQMFGDRSVIWHKGRFEVCI